MTAIAQDLPKLDQYEQPRARAARRHLGQGQERQVGQIATLRSPEARILVSRTRSTPTCATRSSRSRTSASSTTRASTPTAILRALVNKLVERLARRAARRSRSSSSRTRYVGDEHSYQRKLKEAALAYQLEQRWTKEKILAEYLNTIYFGHGNYGVETAARYYFGKGANNLEPAEAALLAAIPKAPSLYDPVEHPDGGARAPQPGDRRDGRPGLRLARLRRRGKARRAAAQGPPARPAHGATRIQPYFVDYVIQQLERSYGERAFTGGFQVYTTLDLPSRSTAEKARRGDAEGQGAPAGSLVSIEPRTGKVRAMVGGRYGYGQREPVQHRHERPAPAGLGLQAVRAARGPRGRHPDQHALHAREAALRPRQPPDLVRDQLHADVRGLDPAQDATRSRTTPSTRS